MARAVRGPKTLGERAINASIWNVAAFGVQYPLRLAGNVIMTRILAPDDFGLMAVILSLHVGLLLLSDVGIGQSILRDPAGGTGRFLRTAWVVQILRGLVLAACLGLIGLTLGCLGHLDAAGETVYSDPRLPALIGASSLVFVLTGMQSTNLYLAVKNMQASRHVAVELGAQVVTFGAMISFALVLENVWALLWGAVAGAGSKTVFSHLFLSGPKMRWCWNLTQVRVIWGFGKWLIAASLGGFLIAHGDRLVLSAMVSAEQLGIYAIAVLWIEAGRQVLLKVSHVVFIPAFSQMLAKRPDEVGSKLRLAFRYYSLTCTGTACLTAGIAIAMIEYLYDNRYSGAIPLVLALSMRNVMQRYSVLDQFILSLGDSRYVAFANLAGGLASLAVIGIADSAWGLPAAAIAAGLSSAPMYALVMIHPRVAPHINQRLEALLLGATVAIALLLGGGT
ncbi:MAG: oligosaccharide flippase family protein [Paracoccaceae bacterium]